MAVFGKTGYALSWVARAGRLGITPEELYDLFRTDPNRVKNLWGELTAEKEKAADAKRTKKNMKYLSGYGRIRSCRIK
jgi:hypothetical protein